MKSQQENQTNNPLKTKTLNKMTKCKYVKPFVKK